MLDDKLEMFLGRCLRPRRSLTVGIDEAGQSVAVACIRCDLQFDSAAEISPAGNLVKYIFQRVKNDPASLSTSLVLEVDPPAGYSAEWTPMASMRHLTWLTAAMPAVRYSASGT